MECFFPLRLLGAAISLLSLPLEKCLTLYPHLGLGRRDVWAQVVWEQTGLMEITLDNGSIFKKEKAIFTMCQAINSVLGHTNEYSHGAWSTCCY